MIEKLLEIFPGSKSFSGEVTVLLVNAIPIVLIQSTVSARYMATRARDEVLQLASDALWGLNRDSYKHVADAKEKVEPMMLVQRTLDHEEARGLIDALNLPSDRDLQEYNELTLGIPKLILKCGESETEDQIAEDVAYYLAQYFVHIEDEEQLREAVSFFELTFLAEGREIPNKILQKLPELLHLLKHKGIFGTVLQRYHEEEDPFIYHSLKKMHSETMAYFAQSPRELETWSTEFRIEAWIDMTNVDLDVLAQEFQQLHPDLEKDNLGQVGQLFALFKLHESRVGFDASASVGGDASKSLFTFKFNLNGKVITIGNHIDRAGDEDRLAEMDQSNPFFSTATKIYQDTPNFKMRIWDHHVNNPASTVCALEAVLQSIGIRYRVTHPDQRVYDFDPSEGTYKEYFTQDELRQQRRQELKQASGSGKKKKKKR
jgi:hypothetical protein